MDDKTLRRIGMGMSTLLGLREQGFFSPYRYAETVRAPRGYPEIEEAFRRVSGPMLDGAGTMDDVLSAMIEALREMAHVDGPPPEPRWQQSWFPRLDAVAAHTLARGAGSRVIVEVGSGHSTRFLHRAWRMNEADRAERGASDLQWSIRAVRDVEGELQVDIGQREGRFVCIDPEPRASLDGLDIDWRREVLSEDHLPLFAGLRAGDIAFFDSSHLLWPGTDVDMILNRILPTLRSGVLVHFHDILLPDPYPPEWAWRGYTEQLGLSGYLLNPNWQILWSSHYARTRMGAAEIPEIAALAIPDGSFETSLWLKRT